MLVDDYGYRPDCCYALPRSVVISLCRKMWKHAYPGWKSSTNFLKVPYRFHGLYAIGCIFFILNIVLFIFNVTMISLRFKLYPSTFKASIRHPTESLFVPAAVISVGTILTNITQYGFHDGKTGDWLIDVMVIMFWVYCGLALSFTCGIYLTLSVLLSLELSNNLINLVQMVDPNLYDFGDDTRMDLSCISPFSHWTSCWHTFHACQRQHSPRRQQSSRHHHWRVHPPGHRIHGLIHGLLCILVPPDDTKAAQGESETRHVYFSWTERVHYRGNYQHGGEPAGHDSQGLYGRR